jgi:hypothetical protein
VFIPSRRLCRALSLKPEISGKIARQARHIFRHCRFKQTWLSKKIATKPDFWKSRDRTAFSWEALDREYLFALNLMAFVALKRCTASLSSFAISRPFLSQVGWPRRTHR